VPPLPATVVMIPARVNLPDPTVKLVRNIEVPRIINGHASRLSQSCESREASVAGKAGTARARYDAHRAVASSFSTRELKVSEM